MKQASLLRKMHQCERYFKDTILAITDTILFESKLANPNFGKQ